MQITQVTYRELRSGGGFSHRAIEVAALVEPDETPEQALERVKWWVRSRHHEIGDDDRSTLILAATRDELKRETDRLAKKRNQMIKDLRLITRWRVWREELRGYWRYFVLGKVFRHRAYRSYDYDEPDRDDDLF